MKYFQQQLQLTLNIVFWLFCSEKHIIVGAEEGVYSLNFSEQLHEAEMEQVLCESKLLFKVLNFYGLCKFLSFFQISARRCTWLSIFQSVMVSLQGISLRQSIMFNYCNCHFIEVLSIESR